MKWIFPAIVLLLFVTACSKPEVQETMQEQTASQQTSTALTLPSEQISAITNMSEDINTTLIDESIDDLSADLEEW